MIPTSLIRVLVVDDDPMVLQINREYVAALTGFTVVGTARTGAEAVAAVQNLNPNLVLLDIYLPDMDGVSTLKEIRRCGLSTDVIMVSAAQDSRTIREVLRFGAVDYVIKPFRRVRLNHALQTYQQMWRRLGPDRNLSQDQVDLMLGNNPAQTEQEVPKGVHDITMRQVLLYLVRSQDPVSAADVAGALGISRATARRYLDYLGRQRKVDVDAQYGSVGRPVNLYRLVAGER